MGMAPPFGPSSSSGCHGRRRLRSPSGVGLAALLVLAAPVVVAVGALLRGHAPAFQGGLAPRRGGPQTGRRVARRAGAEALVPPAEEAAAEVAAVAEAGLTAEAERRGAARQALLAAIEQLDRGFVASEADRRSVAELIDQLVALNPTARPTAQLGGNWTLLYTDAPDILGIPTGPFSRLGRIGQEIDPVAGTIANVIEYRPSAFASGLVSAAEDDALIQRVFTNYEATSPTTVDLRIRGLSFTPQRVLGVEVPSFLRSEAKGPLSLPFGKFEILYLDQDLRIVRTGQGWCSVNRRYTGKA